MTKRWPKVMLLATAAGGSLGCPSLSEIGVGGGDAGRDRDEIVDVAPPEARTHDVAAEAKPCTSHPTSDPKNCGTCGHDCRGGACEGGQCQPYALVTGTNGPWGVAVSAGVLYFTAINGTVEKCRVDDCMNSLKQVTSGQGYPRGITTDSTSIYWANLGFVGEAGFDGSIATCGLAGCPEGAATQLTSVEEGPMDLAVNANGVYWTDAYGELVRRCDIDGCGHKPTTLATDPTLLSGVAIDATSIYWAEPKLGNIIKCPLGGCASFAPFAAGQTEPQKIDIVNDTVFWSTKDAIMSCPTSGCAGAPAVFAKNQSSAFAIAHDETHLYWTLFQDTGAKVLSCPLSACVVPTVLADQEVQPASLAVDEDSVYWANSGGSTVMRVMK